MAGGGVCGHFTKDKGQVFGQRISQIFNADLSPATFSPRPDAKVSCRLRINFGVLERGQPLPIDYAVIYIISLII